MTQPVMPWPRAPPSRHCSPPAVTPTVMMSLIPRTPCRRTSSATLNASLMGTLLSIAAWNRPEGVHGTTNGVQGCGNLHKAHFYLAYTGSIPNKQIGLQSVNIPTLFSSPVSRRSLGMVMRVSTEAFRLASADLAYGQGKRRGEESGEHLNLKRNR